MKTIRASRTLQPEPLVPGASQYCKFYRLKRDVLAIANVNGERTAVTVQKGAIIRITSADFRSDPRMLEVNCEGESFVMFKIDLKERGEEVSGVAFALLRGENQNL